MRKAFFCILLVAIMLFMTACPNPLVRIRQPCNQQTLYGNRRMAASRLLWVTSTIGVPRGVYSWMEKMSNST